MKKLFRKFFSLDEPAKGAFFGLTVLMAWLWLIFSGLCLFWDYLFFNQLHRLHYNVIQFSWVVMTLLGLVSTALCIAPLYALCLKENGFIRRHRYGFLVASSLYCLAFTLLVILDLLDIEYLFAIYALIVLLHMRIGIAMQRGASIRKKVMFGLLCGAVASLCLLCLVIIVNCDYFFLGLFLVILLHLVIGFLMLPGTRTREKVALVLLWGASVLGFSIIFAYSILPFYYVIDKLSDGPDSLVHFINLPILTPIREGLHISGYGWSLLALLSYVCCLGYYLVSAKILARIGQLPLRRLFGRRVLAILAFCTASYIVLFVLAWREERNYDQVLMDLERRFGKPVTFSAWAQEYYGQRKPDPGYWRQLEIAYYIYTENRKNFLWIAGNQDYYLWKTRQIFLSEWDDELYRKWKDFFMKQSDTKKVDALLDCDIPPAIRQKYNKPYFDNYLWFDDWDIARNCLFIEAWFLRFAIDCKDKAFAESILAKMEKVCWYLCRDDFFVYRLSELFRMEAVIRFVESGLADNEWIDRQIAYIDNLEKELPALEKQAIYHDAVVFARSAHDLAHNLEYSDAKGADLGKLKCFFPAAWWHLANHAKLRGRGYQSDTFSQRIRPDDSHDSFIAYPGGVRKANIMKELLVSLQGVKTLLAAEKIRMRTGVPPQALMDLPLDPFTGQALQYTVGACEVRVDVVSQHKEEKSQDEQDEAECYDCKCGCDGSKGCQCEQSDGRLYADCKSYKRQVNAMQVFSPGANAAKSYDDIRFFIRLKTPSNK